MVKVAGSRRTDGVATPTLLCGKISHDKIICHVLPGMLSNSPPANSPKVNSSRALSRDSRPSQVPVLRLVQPVPRIMSSRDRDKLGSLLGSIQAGGESIPREYHRKVLKKIAQLTKVSLSLSWIFH